MVRNESGQTTVEYILLLAIVVGFYLLVVRGIRDFGLGEKLMKPLKEDYRRAYQYGHPKAKGLTESGGPDYLPRTNAGGRNFRMFLPTSEN